MRAFSKASSHSYIRILSFQVFKGMPSDLKEKQREYWIKEVEIMMRLNHPNVIRGIEVPGPLKNYLQSCVPPMCMEYCRGGDLRRFMARTENVCGLAEKDVRNILRDICRGLIYLHKERIIHRDLKPENIVIHIGPQNQRVYKIIDLGYAKELAQASLAQSFVGTIAYLAPELFERLPYNYTVDYWSLGVLAYEMATGERPFCQDRGVPDLNLIKKKKDQHISINVTGKNFEFISVLPDWCKLNDVFKTDLSMWLRTMLAYNPKNRSQEPGSPTSLERMLSLLNRPLANVLNVNSGKVVTFTSSSTQDDFYVNTMIPNESQFILSTEGKEVGFDHLLQLGTPRTEDASICAYLFHMKGTYNLTTTTLPHNIRSSLASYPNPMPSPVQKKLWRHMYNHIAKEFGLCCEILASYRALLVHINATQSEFSSKLTGLSATYKEVKLLAEMLLADKDYDHKQLQRIQHSALEELRSIPATDFKATVPAIKEKMRSIVAKANSLHSRVMKLRENPFGRSKPPEQLENLRLGVLNLVENLKRRNPLERDQPVSNSVMIDKFREFTEEQTRILKEVSNHIIEAVAHLNEVRQTVREVDDFIRDVEKVREYIFIYFSS